MGFGRHGLFHLRQKTERDDADDRRHCDLRRVIRGEQLVTDDATQHWNHRSDSLAHQARLLRVTFQLTPLFA